MAKPAKRPARPPETEGIKLAKRVLETEAQAILGLVDQLDSSFDRAVDVLHDCRGRVIATGMGKSGIIAHKLAATLSSTGTPSIFLHPAEALHGDLGVMQAEDVVVALSLSGETDELVRLLEAIRRIGAKLISITGSPSSTLGQASDVTLSCQVAEEACPMNLAPTASTTATLALGDALALALSRRKGFREDQFASLHPGGHLGKKLLRVEVLMQSGDAMPKVVTDTRLPDVIEEITRKGLGMTCVVDDGGRLAGVVTDGDLRRHYLSGATNPRERLAREIMTTRPVTIKRQTLAVEAIRLLEERKITSLVVVDSLGRPEGVVHLHGLWRTQMI
jgi:arabinose-5-phosphate isomerase